MHWVRKGFIYLLALLLLFSLIFGAVATSINSIATKPHKISVLLNSSGVYDAFVTSAIEQAQKSDLNNVTTSSVSLSDPAVTQAARAAFSDEQIQRYVDTFLSSNYDWLNGKSSTPNFNIDLTSAKQAFAKEVGDRVQNQLANLPVCSTSQLAQLQNLQQADPLTITCRPAGLNPQTEAARISQEISNNTSFLSNQAITAANINPNRTSQSKPYYVKLSFAPKTYRVWTHLPWLCLVLGLASASGIIFLSRRRRQGVRKVGIVLLIAGLVLVIDKLIADFILHRAEHKLFNPTGVGALQKSLTEFLNKVVAEVNHIDFWFGIGFLVAAILIFAWLYFTRNRQPQPKSVQPSQPSSRVTPTSSAQRAPSRSQPPASAPLPPKRPTRPKKPRLIQ